MSVERRCCRTRRRATAQAAAVGFVHPISPKGVPPNYVAFHRRLRELGYAEGDKLFVEYINLDGHPERYDEAMQELVRRRVDLIFALGQEENLRAAMAATSTIPDRDAGDQLRSAGKGLRVEPGEADRKRHRRSRCLGSS